MECYEATRREFAGKNVLITGASGGLGRSFALQLASCGLATLILSARNTQALEEVANDCKEIANDDSFVVHIIPCELADPKSVELLASTALKKVISPSSSSVVDILINNGGVSSRSRFIDTQLEVDQRVMQINFLAGAALAKAVIPGMIHNSNSAGVSGRIIWISSVQGLVGIPERSSYAASKFAVQGYCESIRAELSTSGVCVHTVSPGYIRTNLSRSAFTGELGGTHGKLDATTAAGADPLEVAATVLNKVAVQSHSSDIVVAAGVSAKAAIWLRLLCPGFLRSLLVKRYEKSQASKAKQD